MLRKIVLTITAVGVAATMAMSTASANSLRGDGLALIWVTIEAYPGEGLWQACRRVYQHDVYHVRGGPDIGLVRCNVDHSRINH